MARTVTEVQDELERLFPPEWSDNVIGLAILFGIATVLASRELAFDEVGGWLEQMFVTTADMIYLDEHGAQLGVERLPGETDDDYRARVKFKPRILTGGSTAAGGTGGNVLEELGLYLGEGYAIAVEEPYRNVLDDGFFVGDTSAILTDRFEDPSPKFLGWVTIPVPEVVYGFDCFLDLSYLGVDTYLDEKIEDLDRWHIRRILEAIEEQRGYGIAIGVTVADIPQTAYFAFLHEPASGGWI